MSKFQRIDEKLNALSQKLNASIGKDDVQIGVNGVMVPQHYIESRRIEWVEGTLGRAIIISPQIEMGAKNFDNLQWNLINVAWLTAGTPGPYGLPFRDKYLLRGVGFETIEKNIDLLLEESVSNLSIIQIEDLK